MRDITVCNDTVNMDVLNLFKAMHSIKVENDDVNYKEAVLNYYNEELTKIIQENELEVTCEIKDIDEIDVAIENTNKTFAMKKLIVDKINKNADFGALNIKKIDCYNVASYEYSEWVHDIMPQLEVIEDNAAVIGSALIKHPMSILFGGMRTDYSLPKKIYDFLVYIVIDLPEKGIIGLNYALKLFHKSTYDALYSTSINPNIKNTIDEIIDKLGEEPETRYTKSYLENLKKIILDYWRSDCDVISYKQVEGEIIDSINRISNEEISINKSIKFLRKRNYIKYGLISLITLALLGVGIYFSSYYGFSILMEYYLNYDVKFEVWHNIWVTILGILGIGAMPLIMLKYKKKLSLPKGFFAVGIAASMFAIKQACLSVESMEAYVTQILILGYTGIIVSLAIDLEDLFVINKLPLPKDKMYLTFGQTNYVYKDYPRGSLFAIKYKSIYKNSVFNNKYNKWIILGNPIIIFLMASALSCFLHPISVYVVNIFLIISMLFWGFINVYELIQNYPESIIPMDVFYKV